MNLTFREHEIAAIHALGLGTRKGEQKKAAIIKATLQCIATDGYEHTNYETIGEKIGMKRPHVLYHFPNKNKLFEAAIRFLYGVGAVMVEEAMQGSGSTWQQKLKAYVLGTYTWLESDPNYLPVLTLAFYLSSIDKTYKKMSTEVRDAGEARIDKILQGHPRYKTLGRKEMVEKLHAILVNDCLKWATCIRKAKMASTANHTFDKMLSLLD